MVKAATLAFCSIQQHFIRDVHVKFFISQSPDIEQNSDWCISDFPISGQSLIQGNCHNSTTSDDIDMKLEPVIWQEKQNNFKNLRMTSCRKIVKSVLFFQLTVNLEQSKAGFWSHSLQNVFSLTVTFYLPKAEKKPKKSLT